MLKKTLYAVSAASLACGCLLLGQAAAEDTGFGAFSGDRLVALVGSGLGWVLSAVLVVVFAIVSVYGVRARRREVGRREALAEELQNVQRTLRETREQLSIEERLARVGSWAWDIETDHITWSNGCYEIFGIYDGKFGTTFDAVHALIDPNDLSQITNALDRTLKYGDPYRVEVRAHRRDDGQEIFIEAFGELVIGPDDKPAGLRGSVQDITARMRAENALRANEERLRSATRLADVGHVIWDAVEDRCLYCSEVYAAVHGLTVSQYMVNSSALDGSFSLVHPDDRPRYRDACKDLRQGRGFQLEYRVLTPDGAARHVREIAEPVFDKDGRVVQENATIQDITHIKAVEAELRRAKEEADLANRAKSEFLANISHELRTPLNSVIGFAEMLLAGRAGPITNDKQREYLSDIRLSGSQLLELIGDILEITRIEASETTLEETEIEMPDLLRVCVRMVTEKLSARAQFLKTDIAADMPRFWGDARCIRQIVLNLLTNAIKFTPAGGEIALCVDMAEDGGCRIVVSDTGIGIAEKDLERVLEPFEQVARSQTRAHEGTGLGLPLVKALTALHGGTVNLDSEIDRGTTVTIRFPPERTLFQRLAG